MGGFNAVVEEGRGGGTYVDGIVVPVPEGKRDEYAQLAGTNAKVFMPSKKLYRELCSRTWSRHRNRHSPGPSKFAG